MQGLGMTDDLACYYRLNLSTEGALMPMALAWALKKSAGNMIYDDQVNLPLFAAKDILTPSWIDQFYQATGLFATSVIIFQRQQDRDTYAHCDDVTAAINWCLTKDSREMLWYDPLIPENWEGPKGWNFNELMIRDICRIGDQPTLIRTDLPHSITPGTDHRVSVSVRFQDPSVSWQRTAELFSPLIIK